MFQHPDRGGLFILYFVHADSLDDGWLPRLEASIRSLTPLPIEARICLAEYSSKPSVPGEFVSDMRLSYIHRPAALPFNRSWSINFGYRTFRRQGDTHFFFSDIDLVFPERFLLQAREISDRISGIVVPHVYYFGQATPGTDLSYSSLKATIDTFWRQFYGGCCMCSTRVFEAAHGFDEMFVGWGAEDNDFVDRVVATGALVMNTPNLKVLHMDHPRSAEQNLELVERNRARLTAKARGEVPLIDDVSWGV